MNKNWLSHKIGEIMNSPKCISINKTVADVLLQMEANEINHLPVTETGAPYEKLLGIVTRRDLEKYLLGDPASIKKSVKSLMTPLGLDYSNDAYRRDAHILTSDDTVSKAVEYLTTRVQIPGRTRQIYVSAIMVVDSDSRIVGVVGYKHILRGVLKNKEDFFWLKDRLVTDVMKKVEDLYTVEPSEKFENIFSIFKTQSYRTIPVVEKYEKCIKLLGLIEDISAYELMRSDLTKTNIEATHPSLMYASHYLHLVYKEQSIYEILEYYLERPSHDALLVVANSDEGHTQCLEGLISYVDVFKILVEATNNI